MKIFRNAVLIALVSALPAAAQVVPTAVTVVYGTITLPPGTVPSTAPYVVASVTLPSEVATSLAGANPSIAAQLTALRDTGGPNTPLPDLFTSGGSRPEAAYFALVAKPAALIGSVHDPVQILTQAISLGLGGTGTGQAPSSPVETGPTLQSYTYPNLVATSGPGCGGGCPFTGRVDVSLYRLDFGVTNPTATVFVPIILSSGGLNGAFFTSELTLVNRGTASLTATYAYTPAFGDGAAASTASESLDPNHQKIVPDAIEYLRSLGIQTGTTGNRGGTLRITFTGLSSPDAGAAVVRTTSAVAGGRAGLAYSGLGPTRTLADPVWICGLRQSAADRSNVAVLNAGAPGDGNVTLRLTVVSGDPASPLVHALPDVVLAPGGFFQSSGVLAADGLDLANGYVEVERVAGTAPWYAYGVVNDQANADGSFIAPVAAAPAATIPTLTLPVVVETAAFSTEVVLTNTSDYLRGLTITYYADALFGGAVTFTLKLQPGEQQILPAFVQVLRDRKIINDLKGPTYLGPLVVRDSTGDTRGLFVGGRTSTPGGGGEYGLFTPAVPSGSEAVDRAWVYGLRQDSENRSNLALVNTGEADTQADVFDLQIWNGANGAKVDVPNLVVGAHVLFQINAVLATYAPLTENAFVLVTRTSGSNPFLVYGVINDGALPGQRTGDGAYLAADVPGAP
ncbi:MAG TPA: hypothetical protein VMN04_05520 [Thermoanaerobaculia bacterium]|nr:hypothetical protein [Thermoanaerobaculia bacterium]